MTHEMKPLYPITQENMAKALLRMGLETDVLLSDIIGIDPDDVLKVWIFFFKEHDLAVVRKDEEIMSKDIWENRDDIVAEFLFKKRTVNARAVL